jgi:hypothetical protein
MTIANVIKIRFYDDLTAPVCALCRKSGGGEYMIAGLARNTWVHVRCVKPKGEER